MSGVCISYGESALPGISNLVPCGEDAYLCRNCAVAAARCFEACGSPVPEGAAPSTSTSIPTPMELVAAMDRSVIGQSAAKQALSVAMWKHLQRRNGNTNLPPAHVLLYGPTGCGKTHLVRTIDINFEPAVLLYLSQDRRLPPGYICSLAMERALETLRQKCS